MVRVVCISDTHSLLSRVRLPYGDILAISGDITDVGDLADISLFVEDVCRIQHQFKHVVCIAGNHDFCFENGNHYLAVRTLKNAGIHYLQDETVELEGLKIYGSPYTPWFYDWAFNLQPGQPLKDKWAQIPETTNVLLTHGPAYGVLDLVPRGQNVGCVELGKRMMELHDLKLHVAGHIHCSYGRVDTGKVISVNASVCNESYWPINKPIVVDI